MLITSLLAQAAAAAALPAAGAQQGVVSYGPDFFAAQQPSTAYDMVERLPGFSLDNGDSVRGFEGAAGNVLIDGRRPASKSDRLEDILRRIPASSVVRIEVIRGGAPGVDMQGKPVLANVIRARGGGLKGMVEVKNFAVNDGRQSGGFRVDASGELGGRAWEVSAQARKAIDDGAGDGPGLRTFGSGAPAQPYYINAEGDGQQYTGTAAFETPALGGSLRLNGRFFSDKYKSQELDQFFAPSPGVESDRYDQLEHQSELGISFTRKLGAAATLEAIGLRQTRDTDLLDDFFDGASHAVFGRSSDRTETIGRLVLKRGFGERLSVEVGGETAVNKLDSATRYAIDGAPVALPAADVQVEEKRSEGFIKSSWRPAAHWTFDGGVRFETSTITSTGDVSLEKTLRYLKPRLTVTWAPREGTQLRLRGEREVGQLDFKDFVATANLTTTGSVFAGNPDITPEQSWVAEIALEQRFWTSGSVVITARRTEISDVIDRAPVVDASGNIFDNPANIGDGTKSVLKFELTLPTDRFGLARGQLKGSVRRGWTRVTDPTTHEKRRISGYHPTDWETSFSQDVPRWNLTWGVEVYGSFTERYYRFNQVEDFKLASLVRPYVEIRPRPDLNVRMEIFNATSRGLRDFNTTYPGPRSAGGAPDVQARNQLNSPYGVFLRLQKKLGG